MTLFAKTSAALAEIEAELAKEGSTPGNVLEHKAALDAVAVRFEALRPTVDKFEQNANETDVDKKIYGALFPTSLICFF